MVTCGNWSVPKILYQFISAVEQIDLTVDGNCLQASKIWLFLVTFCFFMIGHLNKSQQEVDQLLLKKL